MSGLAKPADDDVQAGDHIGQRCRGGQLGQRLRARNGPDQLIQVVRNCAHRPVNALIASARRLNRRLLAAHICPLSSRMDVATVNERTGIFVDIA